MEAAPLFSFLGFAVMAPRMQCSCSNSALHKGEQSTHQETKVLQG